MIVITGATGNVGQHVVTSLADQGLRVRALSRTKKGAQPPVSQPGSPVEWVAADFNDPASLKSALEGATGLVLISPAHRDMQAHQEAVIDAAVAVGVKRIAKLSGLGAGPDAPIRLPKLHYAIEQHIVRSGIAHSFVRPNLFMQVLLGSAPSIANDGVVYAPAGHGAISFIDARDVAACLATEVQRTDGSHRVCEITGPQALTYSHAAEVLSTFAKHPVRHVDVTPQQARDSMVGSGMDTWLADAFVELFGIYRAGHGSAVLSAVVESTIGRPAISFANFAQHYEQQWKKAA